MAYVDEETPLTRAHLAIEAGAIGHALLDGDFEEARFRAHLLHSQASDLQLDGVARAAQDVVVYLPSKGSPTVGIGRAMLRLSAAVDIARGAPPGALPPFPCLPPQSPRSASSACVVRLLALGRASIEHEFDKACFRTHCIPLLAADAGCLGVWRGTLAVSDALEPVEAPPITGYGRAFVSLTRRLEHNRP